MTTPFQAYTKDQWQQIMTKATHAHDLPAVQDAAAALNEYDKQSVQATSMSSLGPEVSAVGKGLGEGITGIPKGLQQIAHQIGQGDVVGAGKTVWGGVQGLSKGIANAAEIGADALDPSKSGIPDLLRSIGGGQPGEGLLGKWEQSATGDYMPESERLQKMETGASTLPGLGLARATAPAVKGAVGKVVGTGLAPVGGLLGKIVQAIKATGEATPDVAKEAAGAALGSVDDAAAFAKKPQESSPASSTPAQPLTPMPGTGGRGFTAEGSPTRPVTSAMTAHSQMIGTGPESITPEALAKTQWIGTPNTPQFEEGLPAARTSTMPSASKFDIDTYLRKIQQALTEGYGPTGLY